MDCRDSWEVSRYGKGYCSIHKKFFIGSCPHLPLAIKVNDSSDEIKVVKINPMLETNPLIANGKRGNDKKGVPKNFTSNSRPITSKSRGVTPKKSIACKSIYERFHNYGVKFDAVVLWDYIFEAPINLRNGVQFKRLNFDVAIVKVFRRSILVTLRANQEVRRLDVKEAEKVSILKVNSVLDRLPKSIQLSPKRDIVNVHNAFVNHPFAEREVRVSVGGDLRFISDNSKGFPEFEAINPAFAIPDSEFIERDIVSLIDKGLSRDFLAQSINVLIRDRGYYAENLKSHVLAIRELAFQIKRLNRRGRDVSG